jgi:hypothetical protein
MLNTLTRAAVVLLALLAGETPSRMGYDAHITRAQDWTESHDHPITLDEWKAYLRSDREMRLDHRARATTSSGETITTESPGLAVWVAWNQDGVGGGHAWFSYDDGAITVKDPDRDILRKMFRIAVALNGRVQGDDGENYDANGNPHQP